MSVFMPKLSNLQTFVLAKANVIKKPQSQATTGNKLGKSTLTLNKKLAVSLLLYHLSIKSDQN